MQGLDRHCWSKAGPVRKIFQEAFAGADLSYHSPHSVRSTLARFGQTLGLPIRTYKARNLGHSNMITTFSSYGDVPADEQAELIRSIKPDVSNSGDKLAAAIAEAVRKHNFKQ